MESLYSLSRAILLAETDQPLARHIAREISRIYELPSVIIYDRDTGQMHRGGPGEIPGIQKQILDSAAHGTHFRDDQTQTIVSTISFGGQPSGSVALKGASLSDVALQGLLNLIALGLEKARGQEAATRAEAARQSEEFKSTLLDALAHEFKTPLTSIRAATTGILASGSTKPEELRELLAIMDQEANRLSALVNEAIHLARIEAGKVQLNKQACPARTIVDAALTQMNSALEGRHTSVMLTFISFWRAAAIVLCDLGSSAFYVGGIAEQAVGKAAPWFILGVMCFSYAVRALYVESCAMFTRGGVYRVVKEAMGGTLAKLSVSALMFDYILTGPISGVSAGQYIVGLLAQTLTYFGHPWQPSKETINLLAAGIAVLITLYFWWRNTKGLHESSDDALRIMYVTTVMVVLMILWSGLT